MTLRPLVRPLVSFISGTPRIHQHHPDGFTEGRLYRAGAHVCVVEVLG